MRSQRSRRRPTFETLEWRLCLSSTTVLPISAFLAQQGHDTFFAQPVRDQLDWSNSVFDPGTGTPNR